MAIYYLFKADYYALRYEESPSISDHNDHYFEAEDEFEVSVSGTAVLIVDKDNLDAEDFSECVVEGSMAIDSIDSIWLTQSSDFPGVD